MLIKYLEPKFISKIITLENGEKEKIDIPNGFYTLKMEIDNISMFREAVNEKTGKIYKTRSFLKINEGWLLVKHSIDELLKMKKKLYNTIEIKGFKK